MGAISDLETRALNAVSDFLKAVAESNAVCGLEYRGERFAFGSVDDVALAADRMGPDSFTDSDVEIVGQIMGYLPDSRRVEIKVLDPGMAELMLSRAVIRAAVAMGSG